MVIVVFIAIKFAYIFSNNFYGFQWQPTVPTIEGVIRQALVKANISFDTVKNSFDYAGRTDKGVHAWDQTVKVLLNVDTIPQRLLYRINTHLPKNIVSWAYAAVDENFSPRFHAESRTYSYIYVSPRISDFNFEIMNAGALKLIGTHDFRNFCKHDSAVEDYQRKILALDITPLTESSLIHFKITGQSFLWQQVRRTVKHLIELGTRMIAENETELLLEDKSKKKPMPMPAEGLILDAITYPSLTWSYEVPILRKFQNNLLKELITLKTNVMVLQHINLLQSKFI